MLLAYTLDEYEQELSTAQEAFLSAARSRDPIPAAALKSLQEAFPTAEFDVQGGALVRKEFDDHDKLLLDDVFRSLLVRITGEAISQGAPVMLYSGAGGGGGDPLMRRLLDMIKWMVVSSTAHEATLTSPRVVDVAAYCKQLEDLLELGTISDCQDVFQCMMEADLKFLASEVAPSAGSHPPSRLTLLRTCNSLLRRLSKANDVQLCGRILVFIARLYPLTDKSGLNLTGVVNAGVPLPIDDVQPDDVDSVGQPVDAKLYNTFWGLQNAFKNPSQLLQAGPWSKFRDDMCAVLDAFDTLPITVPATGLGGGSGAGDTSTSGAGQGAALMDVDDGPGAAPSTATGSSAAGAGGAVVVGREGGTGAAAAAAAIAVAQAAGSSCTSVKYLTSSKLFGLQVRDGTFRRQFLVQALAQLHFMAHPFSTAKDKNAILATKFDGLEALNDRVYAALAKTVHAGDEFAHAVRAVLERETQWVAWKRDGCPNFEKTPAETAGAADAAGAGPGSAAAAEAVEAAPQRPAKRRRHGRPQTSFAQLVTEPEDQLAGLAKRSNMPSKDELLAPIKEDLDPEMGIEEAYRRGGKGEGEKVLNWKANRVMARTNVQVFATSKDLEEMILKVDPDLKKKVDDHKAAEEERARREQAQTQAAPRDREDADGPAAAGVKAEVKEEAKGE